MGLSKQKNKLNTQGQSGLTLIELMIAVAIIGILAAIALPSFNSVIKQKRMRLVVDTVVGDFRQSESLAQAAGAGQSVVLEISNPGASWTYTVTHSSSGSVLTRQASDFSGAISLSVTGSDFSDAGNTTFTISSLVTTSVGTASATQILAGTAWQDADRDGNQINPSLQYEGTVLAETWNQTIADLVSATPSPGPESSTSPELEPEPSPWTAAVQFSVTSNGGSGKYEYSVTFADGTTCTNPNGGQSGGYTCQTSTSLATLDVSGTADASQVLCSITPASPYAQTLSTAAPTLTVTLVVAQNSNKC